MDEYICISLDETTTRADMNCCGASSPATALPRSRSTLTPAPDLIPADLQRTSAFLTHPVFNSYREHEMLRACASLPTRIWRLTAP